LSYRQPRRRKVLDDHAGWLKERFERHRGNADVVRQELAAERGIVVSLRTIERAVEPYRRSLAAQAGATTRFETPPGKQLQIDFGERLVEIAGTKIKAFLFVATLGYSRRLVRFAMSAKRAGSRGLKVRLPSSAGSRRKCCSTTRERW
jgi:transposase